MIRLIKTMIKIFSNHNNFEKLENMISYKAKRIIKIIIRNKNNNKFKKIKITRHLYKPNKKVYKINKKCNKKKIKKIINNKKNKTQLILKKIFKIINKILKIFNRLISKKINRPLIKYNLQINRQIL
jgi:hypothetical protein